MIFPSTYQRSEDKRFEKACGRWGKSREEFKSQILQEKARCETGTQYAGRCANTLCLWWLMIVPHEDLTRASLVARWIRTSLPMKGHRFDPWSQRSHMPRSNWTRVQVLKPRRPRASVLQLESSLRWPQLEKACAQRQKPSTAKNKLTTNE